MVSAWKESFYVEAYAFVRGGGTVRDFAEKVGVTEDCVNKWCQRRPVLREAIERGRREYEERGKNGLADFIYDRLPDHLREVWDRLDLCGERPTSEARLKKILSRTDEEGRQRLFLFALVRCNFDASRALRKLNMTRRTLDRWVRDDHEFAELYDEMRWHLGNRFESALFEAVERGDVAAITFANKTFNRDRGYREEKRPVTINNRNVNNNLSQAVQDQRKVVDVRQLNLPDETLRQLAEAVIERRKQEQGGVKRMEARAAEESSEVSG